MNNRLLFITRSRMSENNGGANATKGFIQCFASLFKDCSIIYPIFDHPEQVIPSVYKRYPYSDNRSKIRKGLDVYRGTICANEPFVKQHLRENTYDVIVFDNSFSSASLSALAKATGAKVITIHHNVERDYQHDNRKEYSLLFRFPYIHFAEKAERESLLNSDINITLTAKDATTFQTWYQSEDLHLHPWGIFEYRPIAEKVFQEKQQDLVFVITGSLYFMQSLMPILEFINRYWPIVKASYPTARLIIAGRNPNESLQSLCQRQAGITIIPNPVDMSEVVQQGNYYICPINAGSGLKLRVLDGLKQGLPVLCHDISTAGYEHIAAAGCLFAYHDEPSFRQSLTQMVAAKNNPNSVYQAFKDNFSIQAGIERLKTIIEQEHLI